jgi:DNA-binding NarL/FixJ family response regulator
MNRNRVMVVSGHSLFRLGFRTLLAGTKVTIVGEAASPMEAAIKASALLPQIVVLDSTLPDVNVRNVLRLIATVDSTIHTILLSDHDDEQSVEKALMAGASSYVLKQNAEADLPWAISAAQKSREYFSPALIQRLRPPTAVIPEPDQHREIRQLHASPIEARLRAMIDQALLIRKLAQDLHSNIRALHQHHPHLWRTLRQSRAGSWLKRGVGKLLPFLRATAAHS